MVESRDALEILQGYKKPPKEEIPSLSPVELHIVMSFFEQHDMSMIGGSRPLMGPKPLGNVMTSDTKGLKRKTPGSMFGPYVMNDEYIPSAIGVWGNIPSKPQASS